MTPNEFRKLALRLPGAEEKSHMNHPDFRAGGKIFATLSYPDQSSGMVRVTPVEQELLVEAEPDVFKPCSGAWGRAGCTNVALKLAQKGVVQKALEAAWQLATATKPGKKSPQPAPKKKTAPKKK